MRADQGLTEEQAVERFGSVPAFLYHLRCRPAPDDMPPTAGDALETYRLMCRDGQPSA